MSDLSLKAGLETIENILNNDRFVENNKFFRHQQPLAFWIRVQFRIPASLIIENETGLKSIDLSLEGLLQSVGEKVFGKGYTLIDDYYGREYDYFIDEVIIDETLDLKEYWVDLTMTNDGIYNNSSLVSFEVNDKMGFKKFNIDLFDRNFSNIERLLFFALQARQSEANVGYERTTVATNTDGKKKAFNSVNLLNKKLSNVRIKFGYGNRIDEGKNFFEKIIEIIKNSGKILSLDDFDLYESWESFSLRTADMTIKETPWIEGVITATSRVIKDEGGYYKISAASESTMLLDNIELEREFAIMRASTFNMLNIVNDVADTMIGILGHKNYLGTDLFKQKFISTIEFLSNQLGDTSSNIDVDLSTSIKNFLENYYNPAYAFDYDDGKLKGDEPNNVYKKKSGAEEFTPVKIDYQLLDSPPKEGISNPRATLGSILNEILLQIPPRRFVVDKLGLEYPKPLSDEDEKKLLNNNGDLKTLGYTNHEISEELSQSYKYTIVEENSKGFPTFVDTKKLNKERKLVFYYGSIDFEQEKIRTYKPRHPEAVVNNFSFDEDNLYTLFNMNVKSRDTQNKIAYIRELAALAIKEINDKQIAEKKQALSEEEEQSLINKLQTELSKIELGVDIFGSAQTISATPDDYRKIKHNSMSLGNTTIDGGSENLFVSLNNKIPKTLELNILGDPYWFFDSHIVGGQYVVKIDVYRTASNTKLATDIILSGYYVLLGIKHIFSVSDGYTTTLELKKINSQKYFEKFGAPSNFTEKLKQKLGIPY